MVRAGNEVGEQRRLRGEQQQESGKMGPTETEGSSGNHPYSCGRWGSGGDPW
jgi:hypothetical protein